MARKFSLKDNPIFQRLEIPRKKEISAQSEATEITPKLIPTPPSNEISDFEGQKESLKIFASKADPQNLTLTDECKKESNAIREESYGDQPLNPDADINAVEKKETDEIAFSPEAVSSGVTKTTGDEVERYVEGQNQSLEYRPSKFTPQNRSQEEEPQEIPEAPAIAPQSSADPRGESQKGLLEDQGSSSKIDEAREEENRTLTGALAKKERQASVDRPEETLRDISLERTPPQDFGLRDNLDKSLFFSFYNEVSDELLPTLDGAEQILYSRLFRLSYGFNRNYCTVSQPILREKTSLSRNTIRTGLQSLVQKEWISVIEAGNHISTTYRVYLPREKKSGSNFDPQKKTIKNRASNYEPQIMRGKIRGSKTDIQEGQKLEVRNLSGKTANGKFSNSESHLHLSLPNFDPQKMPPLLITNNSFTLFPRETEYQFSDEQTLCATAQRLVEKFYSLLAQQPSTAKREKSVAECLALLHDGFSLDQIDYAITWLIAHYPTTGSFSRVAHFIDQALKAREEEQHVGEVESRKNVELERKKLEEKRLEEERKQIDEVKASLSQEEFDTLYQEANRLVENEHGLVRFGRETLIQIKVRELIRARYLQSDRL